MNVRPAQPADAAAAVEVLRRSITELCVADHQQDEATLTAWLANKTEDGFLRWLDDPDTFLIVAEDEAALDGVGALRRSGELTLCYVRPGAQGRGVGAALLAALEEQALAWGLTEITLSSTLGARPFYERHGYQATGEPPSCGFGITRCHPYAKTL